MDDRELLIFLLLILFFINFALISGKILENKIIEDCRMKTVKYEATPVRCENVDEIIINIIGTEINDIGFENYFETFVGLINPRIKIDPGILARIEGENCTGTVDIRVVLFDSPKERGYSKNYRDYNISGRIMFDVNLTDIIPIASLSAVRKIEIYSVPTLTVINPGRGNVTENDPFDLLPGCRPKIRGY